MRADGWGERKVWPQSMLWSLRSLEKGKAPVAFGTASGLGAETPTPMRVLESDCSIVVIDSSF